MKILFLSTGLPGDYSIGGNQRSNHIRDALLQIAEVDTIAFTGQGNSYTDATWNEQRCKRVNIHPDAGRLERLRLRRAARRVVAEACARNRYDFIVARYWRLASLVPSRAHARTVVDADDMRQVASLRSPVRYAFLKLRAFAIRKLARRLYRVWLVDPRDAAAIPGARTGLLPNAARSIATPPAPANKRAKRILMVGAYYYPPNEEGLRWFAQSVLPRVVDACPDVEFHAVGQFYKAELNELHPALVMRGFVDDLAEEYGTADVVICPIQSGSGTQIKAIEAVMAGRPTVVSAFSYGGLSQDLAAGKDLLVADSADDWTTAILGVLTQPEHYSGMTARGKAAAEEAFGLAGFARKVIETFQ